MALAAFRRRLISDAHLELADPPQHSILLFSTPIALRATVMRPSPVDRHGNVRG
jgi:hypothetical protein